jgi:glutaredoxin 3
MSETEPAGDKNTPAITIYTTILCPFCHRAKHLLRRKGVGYREIDVTMRPNERAAMRERAGGRHTVPQIFIGPHHIGGCDELFKLESLGRLDELLGGAV